MSAPIFELECPYCGTCLTLEHVRREATRDAVSLNCCGSVITPGEMFIQILAGCPVLELTPPAKEKS